MLSIVKPIKLGQKISCLTYAKIFPATYTVNAPQLRKKIINPGAVTKVAPNLQPQITNINPAIASLEKVIDNKYLKNVPLDQIELNRSVNHASEETKWKIVETDTSKIYKHCLMLSKVRLSALVVITTMGGYALAPGVFDLQTLVLCSVGTGLVSATANSINQFFEVPFDAQMSRTKNRVLVRGHLSPAQAVTFAVVSGVAGLSTLYFGVNELTAALGAANLVIYTMIYTPLKRISILNTWVGSVVGAIPPLMGWAGCTGSILDPGAWIMSGILYAWQFPHFNALSWNLRPDYSRAGYRMMAVTNPDLCRKTALRYTAGLMALSYLAPLFDVTEWWFAVASTPLNAYFLYLAWRFYQHSDSGSSRKLFRFSLVHLPLMMCLMLLGKKHLFDSTKNNLTSEKNQSSFLTEFSKPFVALMEKS